MAVLGLYSAYGIPILLRRIAGEKFQRGPWHLGQWSPIVGWIAVGWIAFISILFILPQAAPGNNLATFNYAPVAVAVRLAFPRGAGCAWAPSTSDKPTNAHTTPHLFSPN